MYVRYWYNLVGYLIMIIFLYNILFFDVHRVVPRLLLGVHIHVFSFFHLVIIRVPPIRIAVIRIIVRTSVVTVCSHVNIINHFLHVINHSWM